MPTRVRVPIKKPVGLHQRRGVRSHQKVCGRGNCPMSFTRPWANDTEGTCYGLAAEGGQGEGLVLSLCRLEDVVAPIVAAAHAIAARDDVTFQVTIEVRQHPQA